MICLSFLHRSEMIYVFYIRFDKKNSSHIFVVCTNFLRIIKAHIYDPIYHYTMYSCSPPVQFYILQKRLCDTFDGLSRK